MARAYKPKQKETQAVNPKPEAPVKPASRFEMWMEEHWHGWIKPVLGLLLAALAYVTYNQGWLGEHIAGPMLVAVIVGGTIAATVIPVFSLLESARDRNLFAAFVAVWTIAVGYPSLRAALPRTVLGTLLLGENKDHLSGSVDLAGERGPYEISVGGALKGAGDAESSYHITATGEDGTRDEVNGALERRFQSVVATRRGGRTTIRQEHTEKLHRLPSVRGSKVDFTIEGADEQLEDGLHISVHRAGPDPRLFLVLAALCIAAGLFIDYQLATTKVKTYLTMAAGFLFAFAWDFPGEATPHRLVPPAIGSAFIAFLVGGLGGAMAGFIGRQLKPPAKMKPKLAK